MEKIMEPVVHVSATLTRAGPSQKRPYYFFVETTQAERYYNRLISRHGKGKALTIIAKRLGVSVYYMLKRGEPFNEHKFLTNEKMSKTPL